MPPIPPWHAPTHLLKKARSPASVGLVGQKQRNFKGTYTPEKDRQLRNTQFPPERKPPSSFLLNLLSLLFLCRQRASGGLFSLLTSKRLLMTSLSVARTR